MIDRCEHTGCDYENRAEYCMTLAAESAGIAGSAVSRVDSLLFEQTAVTSDEFHGSWDRNEDTITRRFSYWQNTTVPDSWSLTETAIDLWLVRDKLRKCDSYRVAISWMVKGEGQSGDAFTSAYGIDVYSHSIHGFVEQPEVTQDGQLETRRLTAFDLRIMISELDVLYAYCGTSR